MPVTFILDRFANTPSRTAIVWRDKSLSYSWLLDQIRVWNAIINTEDIPRGSVVGVHAEFSPNSIALFFSLMTHGCIFVPFTSTLPGNYEEMKVTAECEIIITIDSDDRFEIHKTGTHAGHVMFDTLRSLKHPGLVLFSSGSTGKSKAAVHDMTRILKKFRMERYAYTSISFLLYDHIGGVNTLLYVLSNSGTIVTIRDRNPRAVLQAIKKHGVELLPTSPSFLNMILLSEAYREYNMDTLKVITYGTEPMPESTLKRFHSLFPKIKLLQTYGLSELGILRSKSRSSDSLWVKVGGDGFETRVVDDLLQIKAESAMLGYLNAESPFTEDGWFMTGDVVEVDGDYIRILGRASEIINVGGEKVYPAEVESVIQEIDGIADATVYGEKNAILGNIVCAQICLRANAPISESIAEVKRLCRKQLKAYKVPVKVVVADDANVNMRFKKSRAIVTT